MKRIISNNFKNITRHYSSLSSLKKISLADSFPIIWDIQKSFGSTLIDSDNGQQYLDFHGGFGSNPIGWNHPKLLEHFKNNISDELIINKPANGDFYTAEYIDFINTFKNNVIPKDYPHLFLIDGGALAVENALKVAMDWKYQKNMDLGIKNDNLEILHFEKAFHGRSGYTMSLTNTEPHKVKYFSKFEWPRLQAPNSNTSQGQQMLEDNRCLSQIHKTIEEKGKDIAAMIIEPIQCEGGDRFFSEYFLQTLQKMCNHNNILFIIDEVQTGFYTTGKKWCFQHYDLNPDLVVFGKKTQQCGIFGNSSINSIPNHCFNTSGRINSTWGGNLVDMIRSKAIINIIEDDKLEQNAHDRGKQWLNSMNNLNLPEIENIRGKGLIMSFDCKNTEERDKLLNILKDDENLLALGCGTKTVRFRPNLAVTEEDIENCVARTSNSIKKLQMV